MTKKIPIKLNLETDPGIIPLESIKVLVSGDETPTFKIINKKILENKVKMTLKHKETKEIVKLSIPIEILKFNRIYYKDPVIPYNDKLVLGVLESQVKDWTCEYIVNDLSEKEDLVVLRCKESNKLIGLKLETSYIQKSKLYIEKCTTYKNINIDQVKIWKDYSCQREIVTRINLLKSIP